MSRVVAIPFGIIGILVMFYTMIKYGELWKRKGWNQIVYWVLQTLFVASLYVCLFNLSWLTNEVIRSIVLRISAMYLVFMIYSTILILIRQLICIVGNKRNWKNKGYRFVRSVRRGMGTILIVCFVFSIIGLFTAHHRIEKTYEIESVGVPIKMTVISDAHIGTAVLRSDLEDMVAEVNATNPDMVFLVGDFFDYTTTKSLQQATTKAFSKIKAPYGVYYVEGNHEIYLKEETAEYFRRAGIQVLQDQVTTLPSGIQIVGRRDFSNEKQVPLETLLQGTDPEKPMILLSHQPRELKEAEKLGVDLVLSGHTHGGQFLGNIGPCFTNDMNYGKKQIGNMIAITSSGIGAWGVPAKFGVPSEMVVITSK